VLEAGVRLTDKQKQQVTAEVQQSPPQIDKQGLRAFLSELHYPLYFLDFETINPAIPPWDNTWPYQQIPFQYSLHVQDSPGAQAQHFEFLGQEGTDPRRALAESLCENIPTDVCVISYWMSFEQSRLRELAELFLDLSAHLMSIHDNMLDLIVPFKKRLYYDRKQQGSNSIKDVLPALFPDDPELSYNALASVSHGTQAAETYLALPLMSEDERTRGRAALLAYCQLDTYAMVRILDKLREAAED
jgi:hypothetical protein